MTFIKPGKECRVENSPLEIKLSDEFIARIERMEKEIENIQEYLGGLGERLQILAIAITDLNVRLEKIDG